jgi:hypothetical protein
MKLLLPLLLLLAAAAAGARAYNVPFEETLSSEQLRASIQRMADAWSESFRGGGRTFAKITDEAATYCTSHETSCLGSRAEVGGLMRERLAGLDGGEVWLTYTYTGGNEALAGWKAAYVCKDGTVVGGTGAYHTRFDPVTGLAVEMNDALDTREIGGALARCAGEDFAEVPGAMEADDLRALLAGVLADHRAILSDDPTLSADREPFAGMDADVEFGWLGGRDRSRSSYVRRVAAWKDSVKSAAPLLETTWIGAASASGKYTAAVECRNGYVWLHEGVLIVHADPATGLATRVLDFFDRDTHAAHFARCAAEKKAEA